MALPTTTGVYRVATDPDLRHVGQNATPVVEFRAAASKNKPLGDGKFETVSTHWANFKIWGPDAERFMNQASKGDSVDIVGQPETESWEDKETGAKRSKDVIRVKYFTVWPKNQNGNGGGGYQQQGNIANTSQQARNNTAQQRSQQNEDPWGAAPQQGSFGGGNNWMDDEPPF